MEGEFVTLSQYADGQLNGFGAVSQETVDELNKALGTTGTGGDGTQFADGTALRPESLEGTLKVVTFQEKHLKLWRKIGKKPAYNTVEEYNVIDSYGQANASAFFEEGGLPLEDDSKYNRKTALVKFLGTTRVITHPMSLVRTYHGDILTRETHNGTLHLLRQLEVGLFYADSDLNPLQFDGLYKLIANGGHVIDMRGRQLNQDALEDGAQRVQDNYGNPQLLFAGTKNIADLSRGLYVDGGPQRIVLPSAESGILLGTPIVGMYTNAGRIGFEPTTFLRPGAKAPAAASSEHAPSKPTVAGEAKSGVAGSMWNDSNVANVAAFKAGTHYYGVSAVGDRGESAVAVTDGIAVAAGGSAEITITHPSGGARVRYYKIYRGTSADNMYYVTSVKKTGETNQVWVDKNEDLPGTNKSFLLDMDSDQSLSWRQLAPLMKIPLATIAASIRFMILLYGTPIVYNPRRNVIYKNVGGLGPESPIQPYST